LLVFGETDGNKPPKCSKNMAQMKVPVGGAGDKIKVKENLR
jgi:hypothetical protein